MKILMTRTRHENNAQICAAATNKTESKNNNSQESQKTETESPNNNSQENQKTASPTAATRSKTPPNDTKDHQGDVRAYTTYQDTKIYHNLHTASVITVTGMYINDDVYHREEGDQKGAIARFVSLTGRVFLVSPDSSWVILSSDMKETACGDIQGHTDDKECTLEAGVAKLSYVIPGFRTWFCKSNKERKGAPLITIGGDWAKLQRRRAIRRSALRAVTPESPGVMPKEENIAPASSDVLPFTHEPVPLQEEQLRTSSPEDLTEELMEEPRVGSVDQQKENIEDLSSDFIALLDEINSITLNGANRNGNCPHDPGGDLDSDLAESSWGHDPHINPWGSLDKSAISGFVIDPENLDTDVGEGEVDEDPPTRSKYDQTDKGESITIMEVIAGTDVKKKDDIVIVATEGDTHGKIVGYNCGYYYDCDYWDEYDIRDKNMEIEPGTRMPSASYLSPCKALLRAGDFVFTGQPPGG